ncbi:phosphopentomutase [Numidum massiliense]|uniref:phosphopentomutase n=1 Tax=Numidum massiliense TaxID=1522315 RepID=UPI0006D5554D|nr:phosphopentomutase [Numidum massiliense]
MAKIVLLVLDSFGIGAMADCSEVKPEDSGAHTYRHIRETAALHISTMYTLGLNQLVDGKGEPRGAYGKAALAHYGADTFMGHQELVGSIPRKPNKRLMKDVHLTVAQAIEQAGYRVRQPWADRPVLLVNEAAVVADNIESEVGNIINVTADLTRMPFPEVVALGKVVRSVVDVSRVIALGGPYTSIDHILSVVKENEPNQWGVDSPRANVYGEGYCVRHMGHGVTVERQFPYIAEQHGIRVHRIGKTADVLYGTGPAQSIVETRSVLSTLEEMYHREQSDAAFLVTVQETDLAGHKEDPAWYASLLNETDRWLAAFIPEMGAEDVLIVTADHGNDPTIGHSRHTREYTPILITGPKVSRTSIGTRPTMADIGATLSDFFGLPPTEAGSSFLADVFKITYA